MQTFQNLLGVEWESAQVSDLHVRKQCLARDHLLVDIDVRHLVVIKTKLRVVPKKFIYRPANIEILEWCSAIRNELGG